MYDFSTRPYRPAGSSFKWELMRKSNPQLGDSIVPLSIADMEFETAPEIKEALANFVAKANLGYAMDTPEFLEAACSWQKRRHGWQAEKNWLVSTAGVVPALYSAVRTYTKVGDGVIVMPPVYNPFYDAITINKRRIVENPLLAVEQEDGSHHYEIDFEGLEQLAKDPATSMLILCSPHNPTGRVWTATELRRIADICFANNVFIVVDEIHNDLIMPGFTHTSFMRIAESAEYNKLIVCVSPSKTFNIAGAQVSCIFIPDEDVRAAFKEDLAQYAQHSLNTFAYCAATAAYNESEAWLEELLQKIYANYQTIKGFISNHMPELEVYPLEGTYLAWIDFSKWGLTPDELRRFNEEKALLFTDEGTMFGTGGALFERINMACPTSVLEAALERLVLAAKEEHLGSFARNN